VKVCEHAEMETRLPGERLAVRIGDAERDSCLEALTKHHTHGRLTADELDLRQRAALTAVTDADLAALLADLPGKRASARVLSPTGNRGAPDARVHPLKPAKFAAAPASLVAGGVLVADFTTDEHAFVVGVAAAAIGYVSHLLVSKWSSKHH